MKKFIIFFLTAFLILGFSPTHAEKMASKVALPPIEVALSPSGHAYSFVSDATFELIATVSGASSTAQVTWEVLQGGSVVSTTTRTLASPERFKPNFQYAGDYTVKATITDGANTQSAQTNVTVMQNFTVSVQGPSSACQSDHVTLTADLGQAELNNLNNFTYQWKKDGQYITGANQRTYQFVARPTTVGDYEVEVSRPGCALATSHPHRFDVLPKSMAVVEPVWYLCDNGSVTITASAHPETNGTPYRWMWVYNDGTTTTTTYTNTPSFTTNKVITGYVKPMYHLTGCNEVDSAEFEVKKADFTIAINTNSSVSNNPVTICNGGQINLIVDVTATPAQTFEYAWYRNNQLIEGVNANSFFDSPLAVDGDETSYNYKVVVTSLLTGCSHTQDFATVIVKANPTITISGDPIVCTTTSTTDGNVNLTATVVGAYTSGKWYKDGIATTVTTTSYSEILASRDYPYSLTFEVTSNNGCTTMSEPYLVYVNSNIHVVVTADYTEICKGGDVLLTANLGDWNSPNLTYQWYTVDGSVETAISGATSLTYRATPEATTTYRFKVKQTTSGCEGTGDINITVRDENVVTTVEPETTIICDGGEVTLTATTTGHVGNIVYKWYENGVLVAGADQSVLTVSPTTVDQDTTVYTYKVMAISEIGCNSKADSSTITVRRNPTLILSGDHDVCVVPSGEINVRITAYIDGQMGSDAIYNSAYITWHRNGSSTTSLAGSNYIYMVNLPVSPDFEPYTIYATYHDPLTACDVTSEPFVVTVHSKPVVTITAPHYDICKGGELTLTANLNDYNEDQYVYQWFKNDQPIHGETRSTYTVPTSEGVGTINYKVVVTQRNTGCSNFDIKPVTIHEDPTITVTPTSAIVCDGAEVTMNTQVTGGVGEISYVWYKNEELIPGANQSSYVDSPTTVDQDTTVYTYKVMAISDRGCNSDFATTRVTVRRNPTLILSGDHDVCVVPSSETNVHISAYIDGQIGDTTLYKPAYITWHRNGSSSTTLAESNYVYMVNLPVSPDFEPYTIYATYYDPRTACDVTSEPFVVTVHNPAVVNITLSENIICEGGDVTLTANLDDYNEDQYTFQWYRGEVNGGNKIHGATNSVYTETNMATGDYNYHVVVTQRHSGCVTTASKTFSVVADPIITEITLNEYAICDGRQVTVTASATIPAGVGSPVYTWYRNGELIEGVTAASFTESPLAVDGDATEYVYSAYVTNPASGCQSAIKAAAALTVYANPTVTISGDPIVCTNTPDNVSLTANVIGDLGVTYQWYENDTPISGETNSTLTITKEYREYPYSFSVKVSNTVGCNTMSEPFLVYVNDDIVVNVTATETLICEGGEVTVTAHLNDWNADQIVYQWSKDGSAIAGATDLNYTTTLNEVRAHTFSFNARQLTSGCTANGSIEVNVVADPIITEITVDEYAICSGGEITITAHTDNINGTPVFTWYRNGELIEGVTAASFTESPLAVDADVTTYTYSAVVTTNVAGCESSIVAAQPVTVYGNPRVAISGDANICETDSVFLAAYVDHISDEVGLLSYTWYVNGQRRDNMSYNIFTANSQFYSEYWPARYEPYVVTVEVTRENGCTTMSEPFYQFVHALPVVNITSSENVVCEGAEVTLTANLNDYTTEHMTYQWYTVSEETHVARVGVNPDGTYIYDTIVTLVNNNIPGATSQTYNVIPVAGQVYGVKVAQTHSECYDTDEITINVLPLPVVASVELDVNNICEGAAVTITANVDNDPIYGTPVYTWYRNGILVEGVTAESFIDYPVTVDGDITSYVYSVAASYPVHGCQSAIKAALDTLNVYPNPTVRIEGDPIVCEDTNIVLTANVNDIIPGTTITYQWRRFNQDIPGATDRVLTTTEPFTYGNAIEYTVVVNAQYNDFIGCQTTSEIFNVVIGSNPRVELTATDTVVCSGGEVTLTANIANSYIENLEINWYANGERVHGAHSLTLTQNVTEETSFYATISSNECLAYTDTVTVHVVELPVVSSVTAYNQENVSAICEGGEIEVTAYMTDENGNQYVDSTYEYVWFRNGLVVENAHGPWFRESLTTVDQDTTHYTYSVIAISSITNCRSIPTNSNTVTVYRNPVVVINGSHNVCYHTNNTSVPNVNLSAYVDGLNYDHTTATTYRWYKNGVLVENTHSLGIQYTELLGVTNQPVVYQVEVIRANGCSAWSEPFEVVVHPAPVLNITADIREVCEGGSISLYGNLDDYNEGNYVYQWSRYETEISDYDAIPGATQINYTTPNTLSPGTYSYLLRVYQRIPSGSLVGIDYDYTCSATDTISVTILPDPVITSITVNGVGNDNSICEGGQLTLTANTENLRGQGIYTWYRNGIVIEGATAATITDSPAAIDGDATTYVYSASVSSDITGCQFEGVVSTETITVYANPVVAISGDANVCQGDSVFLIAYVNHSSDPVGNLTYTWYESGQRRDNMSYNHGSHAGSQFYAEYWYPRAEPYVFTVEVTRGNGCTAMSQPFNVYVHERPEVNITATETNVCEGGEVTLTANLADYTTEHITYQWYTVNYVERVVERQVGVFTTVTDVITNDVPGATSATFTTNVNATTEYGVRVYQTHSECVATDVITINAVAAPVVAAINVEGVNNNNAICEGGQITLTASVEGGVQGGEVYTWYRNGVVIPGATTATLVESPVTIDGDVTTYTYNVTVAQAANGCVSMLTDSVAVNVVVNPNATVAIAGDPIVCNADSNNITLTANVVSDLDVTYQWYEDNAPIADADSNIFVTTKAYREYPYNFSVVVTNEFGCTVTSETFSVNVNAAPVVEVTATETNICEGGEVTLTANLDNANADNLVYRWYANGVAIHGATSPTLTVNVDSTTRYSVEIEQLTSACDATGEIVINVTSVPVISNIAISGVNAGNQICDGGQVTLTASVEGGVQGGEVYTWYRNGVVIPGATTNVLVDSPTAVDGDATDYIYNVTVAQTANGCVSALTNAVAVTVTVNANPTVAVVVDGYTTICEGGSVTLNANVVPATGATYQWYADNVAITGATTSTLVIDNLSARETAYQYHVVVSQASGCDVVSETTAITVVTDPVVNVTVDNATVCVGGNATFTATIEGGVNNINGMNDYSFAWYSALSPNDVIGTASTLNVTAATAGVNTYWVVVSSPYGCETIAYYYDFTVVADPTVTVQVANGYPTQVCEGGSTMLTANVVGGFGTPSYQWYKNGNLLPGETNQTIHTDALYIGAAATYTVNVVMTGVGCEATNSFVAGGSINNGGIVVDAPVVTITGNANTCPGGSVTLTAHVNGGVVGDVYQYQWYLNNMPVDGDSVHTTSELLLGNTYSYRVEVLSTISGCSAASNDVPANVYPEPTVAISGPNPTGISTICQGGTVTLNATVVGGVPGESYTYTWSYVQGNNVGQFTTNTSSFEVPASLIANGDPNHPYYFSVSVMSNNYHCDAVSPAAQSYIINIESAPVANVTVDNAVTCQGGTVTFVANVNPVGVYNYQWTVDGVAQAVNASALTLSNLAVGTHNATVVVAPNGASAACVATATATATVVADPVVTITSNVTEMCAGGTVVLSVANVVVDPAVNMGNYTYEWREDGVLVPNVIGSTFTQTINTPGVHTYALRVISNNGLGCDSEWSNEIQVNVVAQPVVTINPQGVGLLDICVGGQIEMSASVTNANAAQGDYTYTWYANTANTGVTTANYAQTLNAVGSYEFYVVATPTGNSCAPATSNVLTYNVVSDPYWNGISVRFDSICLGEAVELQASVAGGITDNAGNTVGNIVWNVTDPYNNVITVNGAPQGQAALHTPASAGTYTYQPTFVGLIGNGCDIAVNPVHPVEVFARPTASFTSGDGTVVCANDPNSFAALEITINSNYPPFTFTVVGTDGSNNTYYTYNNVYTLYVTPNQSVTYSLTSLEDAHCTAAALNSEATVISSQVAIVDNMVSTCNDAEQPMATMGIVIYSSTPGVAPTVNVLYDDNNYAAYNSYNVPVVSDGTNSTFTFATPAQPGDYAITIQVDGCDYAAVVRVLASQYSYGETPIVNQRWDDVLVVNNNPATNGGHTFVSYQWYKNGQPIEGATSQFYQEIGGVNGYYSVNVIARDENGSIYEITTCDELFVSQSLMKVYPVPAQLNEVVTIEVMLTDEQLNGAVLDIYDAKGAVVRHQDVNSNVIVVSGFETQGSYYGRIITGTGEIKTVKFVIVK